MQHSTAVSPFFVLLPGALFAFSVRLLLPLIRASVEKVSGNFVENFTNEIDYWFVRC